MKTGIIYTNGDFKLDASGAFLANQLILLKDVQGAICSGDTSFVYATDGVGSVAWGWPGGNAPTEDPEHLWNGTRRTACLWIVLAHHRSSFAARCSRRSPARS